MTNNLHLSPPRNTNKELLTEEQKRKNFEILLELLYSLDVTKFVRALLRIVAYKIAKKFSAIFSAVL